VIRLLPQSTTKVPGESTILVANIDDVIASTEPNKRSKEPWGVGGQNLIHITALSLRADAVRGERI
jgi:hypothetical protein